MLRKLIAYDFRCTWKLALLLFVTSMGAALMSMACGLLIYHLPPMEDPSLQLTLIHTVLSLGESLFTMLAYLSAGATLLLSAVHYYKKMISDEAYLTFTLPATVSQHLIAKLVMGFVWMVLGCIVFVFDSVAISIPQAMTMADYFGDVNTNTDDSLATAFPNLNSVGIVSGVVVLIIVIVITQLALIYLALTIGGVIANKHKAVVGVALYWFSNSIVTTVMVIAAVLTSVIIVAFIPESMMANGGDIIAILYICSAVVAGFGVLYYFINRKLLMTKLNLP